MGLHVMAQAKRAAAKVLIVVFIKFLIIKIFSQFAYKLLAPTWW